MVMGQTWVRDSEKKLDVSALISFDKSGNY